jgi:hypothetical protein
MRGPIRSAPKARYHAVAGGVALVGLSIVFAWDLWHPGPNQIELRVPWGLGGEGDIGLSDRIVALCVWVGLALSLYVQLWISGVRPIYAVLGAAAAQYHPLTLTMLSTTRDAFLTEVFAAVARVLALLPRRLMAFGGVAMLMAVVFAGVSIKVALGGLLLAAAWFIADDARQRLLGSVVAVLVVGAASPMLKVGALGESLVSRVDDLYPGGLAILILAVLGSRVELVSRGALLILCGVGYVMGGGLLGSLFVLLVSSALGLSLEEGGRESSTTARAGRIARAVGLAIFVILLLYPSFRTARISGGRNMLDVQPYTLNTMEYAFYVLVVVALSALVVRWVARRHQDRLAGGVLVALLLLDLWSVSHNYYQPFLPVSPASLAKEQLMKSPGR